MKDPKDMKDMTDDELLDEYITVDITWEMAPADCIGEHYRKYHDSLINELKRRGITNEQIEARRKACIPDARARAQIWTDNEETWEQYRRRVYGLTTEEKEKEKEKGKKDNWLKPEPVATLTDMELIDEYVEIIGPDADALEYEHPKAREEVLREELKRRGITDKEIRRHFWEAYSGADRG